VKEQIPVKRLLLAISVVCATAFLVGACSGSSQSSSNPSSTTIATSGSTTTSRSAAAAGPLATVNPCSLLTSSQLPQHQLGHGAYSSPADGVRQCEWQHLDTSSGAADTSAYVLSAAIYDNTGLQNLNETGNTTAPYQSFGQHQARLAKNTNPASNTCEVQISASNATALTVSVDPLLGNIDYACIVLGQAAPILVSNLPEKW
jgi:hypothetical protein